MKFIIPLLLLSIISCTTETLTLEGFNKKEWENDKNACSNNRVKQKDIILENKSKLIGLSPHDVIRLFGQPDFQELHDQTKVSFYYHTTPAKSCDKGNKRSEKIVIDFGSLNTAIVVSIQKW